MLGKTRQEPTDSAVLLLNGERHDSALLPGCTLLDLLRNEAGLTGTRAGCREGDCGACTVILGEPLPDCRMSCRAVCSCILPVGATRGRLVMTVEAIGRPERLSPVQSVLLEEGASQCGFCTPGMVMSVTAYLLGETVPTPEGCVASVAGNICRCTGYSSVIRAMDRLCGRIGASPASDPLSPEHSEWLAGLGVVPGWLPEAPRLISSLPGSAPPPAGDVPVAGGTDVMAIAGLTGEVRPRLLELEGGERSPRVSGGICHVPAMCTAEGLLASDPLRRFESMRRARRLISSPQVRARATVGGNVANASPIGDLTIILIALGATVRLESGAEMPLEDLYLGYKRLRMGEGDLIEGFSFPVPAAGEQVLFEKVGMREHLDIASVCSAARLSVREGTVIEARLSAGGVGPVPMLLRETSRTLPGRRVSGELALDASLRAMGEVTPIDDVRGTAAYKRTLLGRLVIAHLSGFLEPGELSGIL